jgi:outer membrane protein assembly factor BamB
MTGIMFSACSGGGSGSVAPPPASVAPVQASVPVKEAWLLQGGDRHRNGAQGDVGLSAATASKLSVSWVDDAGVAMIATPLVANGVVFVATEGGDVIAVAAATGAQIWDANVGGSVTGTPTLDGNVLIVPVYISPYGSSGLNGSVVALNATTGALIWQVPVAAWGAQGRVRTEPLVANGIVYVGTALGDAPYCYSGTVAALSEVTGDVIWSWTSSGPNGGVGIWSPISMTSDGNVVFGTGNACGTEKYAQAVVALNGTTGAYAWIAPSTGPGPDCDVGSGIAIWGNDGFFTGKDGFLYAVSTSDGGLLWRQSLGALAGFGSIATPATDGVNVVTQSGAIASPLMYTSPGSMLYDYSVDGKELWSAGPFDEDESSSPVITSNVVVVGDDDTLQVRSLTNGDLLYSYDTGSYVADQPAVTTAGIFVTSTEGGLFAFGVGSNSTSVVVRKISVINRKVPAWRPWRESN